MKFIDAEDSVENQMIFRKVSEDGKIEVAIHPVIFGFRVVAGYVGIPCFELNYCAGDYRPYIELIYSLVWTLLEEKNIPFNQFPVQRFKPMNNDPDCYAKLAIMLEDTPIKHIILDGLHTKKKQIINTLWEND